MLIASAVAFGFYIYCILLLIRDRRSPYPVWMHTFYLPATRASDIGGKS